MPEQRMTLQRALHIFQQGGLPEGGEQEEAAVLKAFKRLALKWHPDRNLDNQEQAHQKMTLISAARDFLLGDRFDWTAHEGPRVGSPGHEPG